MAMHPEYQVPKKVFKEFHQQYLMNGLNRIVYLMQKYPGIQEALEMLNTIILSEHFKNKIAEINKDYHECLNNPITQNSILLYEKTQLLEQENNLLKEQYQQDKAEMQQKIQELEQLVTGFLPGQHQEDVSMVETAKPYDLEMAGQNFDPEE